MRPPAGDHCARPLRSPATAEAAAQLAEAGHDVRYVVDPREALTLAASWGADVLISDLEMPHMRGTQLLAALKQEAPGVLVILITAFGSIDLAVRCIQEGAADFLPKPFTDSMLLLAIERVLRERAQLNELERLRRGGESDDTIVARSEPMRAVVELARRAARTDTTVLITGESGVGKGHLARFIHDESARRERTFLQVNCGAIPATLIEAELFGVERGAYTDARESRPGLFREAGGGTLFLDEIGEMPLEAQVKLLQVLETGRVRAVGASQDTTVNVRVIAATNRPLEEALRERRFRPDLYYRLNVIRLEIPPLRERPEDVEVLFERFLVEAVARSGRAGVDVDPAARRWLLRHAWPGNVRELQNVVERAVALCPGTVITSADLVPTSPGVSPDAAADAAVDGETGALRSLAEVEQEHIRRVMARVDGNKSHAARLLGIDRRTLYRKLEEMGYREG